MRLPEGCEPGQQLKFHAPDGHGPYVLRVPERAEAGQTIEARVPSATVDGSASVRGGGAGAMMMNLRVRELTPPGRYFLVRVQPQDSVLELKRHIATLTGTPPAHQRLVISLVQGGDLLLQQRQVVGWDHRNGGVGQ